MLAPLLALLLAAPTPADDSAITVTATKLTPAEAQARATAFVKAVLPTPSYGQYGRWTVPVCIKVTGITDDAAPVRAAMLNSIGHVGDDRPGTLFRSDE